MASLGPSLDRFTVSLLLLLIQLGCFFTLSTIHRPPKHKKRKTPHASNIKSNNKPFFTSFWLSLKQIAALKSRHAHNTTPRSTPASARSSQTSAAPFIDPLESFQSGSPNPDDPTHPVFPHEPAAITPRSRNPFFPLRDDIFPCPVCGEVFHKSHLLEEHQFVKHTVSELREGESGNNVIRIIFTTGWSRPDKGPVIHRILKIHNSPKVLARFEEHRESVKLKAGGRNGVAGGKRLHGDERCMVDGNEHLRFHCSTFLCNLGEEESSSVCSHAFCCACGIIRDGFSPKMDGIATLSSSWRAHVAIPEEMEEEFAFMDMKRAMLVCRVVVGRIGCWGNQDGDADEDGGFDSVLGSRSDDRAHHVGDEDELLVFNPRAVLPCFVIVYSV